MQGYDVVHRKWVPERGEVVPGRWRLAPALVAGGFWLVAVYLLSRVPGNFRWAQQHVRSSPGDNIVWFWPQVELMGLVLSLGAAHGFSVLAHGRRLGAPRVVRWSRLMTWLAVVVTVSVVGLSG